MFKIILAAALLALVSTVPAAATTDNRIAAVRTLLSPWDAADKPGAIVSVMEGDRIIASVAVGSADLEHRVPVTATSVFHAASVSKQVTAFAVLLLEADGKLAIDDHAARYIPEIAPLGTITIRQLLTHTSGLRDYSALAAISGARSEDLFTNDQVLRQLFAQRGTNFTPGTAYQYINSDYVLLAEIIRRVSGETLDAFCQRRIFAPIGMTRSRFLEKVGKLIPDRVQSYRREGNGYTRAIFSNEVVGPTNLETTAEDLNRWARNLETGQVGGAKVIARMGERGTLADGTINKYAMGQDFYRFRGFNAWMHGGRDAGYRSFLLRVPSEKLSIAVFGSVSDFNSGAIAVAVADLYLRNRPGYRATSEAKSAPSPKQLAAYAGTYQLFPGLIFEVASDGSRLTLDTLGGAKPSILPALSSSSFGLDADRWTTLEFATPVRGHSPALTYRVGYDGAIVAKRIVLEPFVAGQAPLADYVGRYFSDELSTEYELTIVNGNLVARHLRHGDIVLRPYQRDRMAASEWFFQSLDFDRDSFGRITSFQLSTVSAEGILFRRIP